MPGPAGAQPWRHGALRSDHTAPRSIADSSIGDDGVTELMVALSKAHKLKMLKCARTLARPSRPQLSRRVNVSARAVCARSHARSSGSSAWA